MKDATSFRTRKSSIYDKKSNTPFKISRSKFFNFLSCKRCFYLDRVKGLASPGMPGWSLNIAVDDLLKKEFDLILSLLFGFSGFKEKEVGWNLTLQSKFNKIFFISFCL